MFNINKYDRRFTLFCYSCFLCACLMLSGVVIAVSEYNTEFIMTKINERQVLNLIIKSVLIFYLYYLCSFSKIGHIISGVAIVYSGISVGIFLMFVLYTMPLYKLLFTVVPISLKIIASVILYSVNFIYEKNSSYKLKRILYGMVLFVSGELMIMLVA